MVVGIGDLTVRHPHHGLPRTAQANRPLQGWTVNTITDIARRHFGPYAISVGEDPSIGGRPNVTGAMGVAQNQGIGRPIEECL